MVWQDIVISISNFLFFISVFNQVIYGFKKKRVSFTINNSAITAIGLFSVSIAFFTLKLYGSAGTTFANATLWTMLLVQAIIYKKN